MSESSARATTRQADQGKERKAPMEPVVSFPATPFGRKAKKLFMSFFSQCSLHFERGIDFKTVSPRIEKIVKDRKWEILAANRTSIVNGTIVAEFYANLAADPAEATKGVIPVRGKNFNFSVDVINNFFGIPAIPAETLFSNVWKLNDDGNLWAKAREAKTYLCSSATWVGKRFKYGQAIKDVRVMKHFISHNISPSHKINTFNYTEACLALAIFTDIPVDVGYYMYQGVVDFALNHRVNGSMPLPWLIHELCALATVPPLADDHLFPPANIMIGPSIPENVQPSDPPPVFSTSASAPPPVSVSSSEQPASSIPHIQDPAVRARFELLEAEMAAMRGAICAADTNARLGFESVLRGLNDLRVGSRGHRSFDEICHPMYADRAEDFDTHMEDDYPMPVWIHPFPRQAGTPPHSVAPGSTSGFSSMDTGSAGFGFAAFSGHGLSGSVITSVGGGVGSSSFQSMLSSGFQDFPIQLLPNPDAADNQGAGLFYPSAPPPSSTSLAAHMIFDEDNDEEPPLASSSVPTSSADVV